MQRIEAKSLREVPLTEIYEEFGYEDLELIDNFQINPIDYKGHNPIERILDDELFPPNLIKKYSEEKLIGTLACNLSIYDDDLESKFEKDSLIASINYHRLLDPDHITNYAIALRIRRSVLAVILEQAIVLDPEYFDESYKNITNFTEQTNTSSQTN